MSSSLMKIDRQALAEILLFHEVSNGELPAETNWQSISAAARDRYLEEADEALTIHPGNWDLWMQQDVAAYNQPTDIDQFQALRPYGKV